MYIHGKNCSKDDLIVVFTTGPEMSETVIRWCKKCGAVVGDIDFDGRTNPGQVFEMKHCVNSKPGTGQEYTPYGKH